LSKKFGGTASFRPNDEGFFVLRIKETAVKGNADGFKGVIAAIVCSRGFCYLLSR
jgi:C4-dicarboxylate transporter